MKRSLSHNDIRSYLHIGAFLFSILFFSFALFSLPYFLGTAPKVEAGSCDARVSAGGVTAYNGQSKTVTASSRWVSVYFYGDASGNNSQARWSSDGNWSSWKSNLPMSFSNTQYVNGGSETYSVQSEGGFWWHRVNCSASVTVRYQNPPSAVISANPSSITEPETTDIDYVCYNSRRAYINGHYIDYRSTDGTLRGTKTYQPSSDQTYTLRCTNTDGDADTDSVTVDVTTPPRCSISMRAGSSTVSPGESTRITWESTYDADGTLIASGQWGQQQAKKNDWGSEVVTPPSSPGTYTYGLSGSDILSRGCSDSVSVTVSSPPPIATLSAIDSSVYKGEGARLSYSCENSDEYSVNTQPKTSASGTHTQSWNTSGTKSNSLVCSDRASGLSDSDGASVEVVNRSPNARYEWSSADGGDTIYINVISNDSDPDGDSVRLSSVGGANYGNASESGGRIRYTAPSNLDGIDVIRYTIVDDDGNNPKTDSTYSYVRVSEEVNPPSVSLSVSPSSVDYGDP
ncbi:MAG: Ig-like domain-containing protein, partial [Candidatus Paceibacterota bacterium]